MPTDDIQRLVTGTAPAPADFTIPGNGQIRPKAINAVFDGTGAAGNYCPTLEIISDAGVVVARMAANSVAAGSSAEVTWAPFLGARGAGTSGGTAGELSYVELTTQTFVTGTQLAQQTLITSGTVTVDGVTKLRVEAYLPTMDILGVGNFIAELWMDATDLGRMGQANNEFTGDIGWPINLIRYLTPAAGAHTFILKGWKTGGTATIDCGTGGPGQLYLPAFLRVSLAVPV